jgi:murein DD-endopeptidase MepM/ murein hydrolase activator NlpD
MRLARKLGACTWISFVILGASGCPDVLENHPLVSMGCKYADPVSCPAERICTYTDPDKPICILRYAGSTPFIRFPFAPDHPVTCTQGARTPLSEGPPQSHSFYDNQYALDLESPQGEKSGTVYSAVDGVVMVTQSRRDPKTGENETESRWGNHVRIFSPTGVMVLYAHLERVFVQDGQPIKAGDAVGVEGESGRAGHRHLHFSVHQVEVKDWIDSLGYFRGHPDEVPPSIPFETQYCDPARAKDCARVRKRDEEIPCGKGSTAKLRADWRN